MNKLKKATSVAKVNVVEATNEKVNVAESVEKSALATRRAIIEGKEQEIIVAHTEYDMELPKDKNNLMEKVDKTKLLKCYFSFARPQVFWDEDVQLYDENGSQIKEGTDNVYVFCPTGDTYWRLAIEEVLEIAEIRDFESVMDYAQAVGTTNLYSRGFSNIEKMGVAALATGDEACKAVFEFAKENKLNITAAKLYLDYKVKPADVQSMTMGVIDEIRPETGRTKEEAKLLLESAKTKFVKNAKKRYVIRVVNSLLHSNEDYSLKQIVKAIDSVTEEENVRIETVNSSEKEAVISNILTTWLNKSAKLKEVA